MILIFIISVSSSNFPTVTQSPRTILVQEDTLNGKNTTYRFQLTLCPLGNYSCFFVACCLFSKIFFSKNSVRKYHLSVKQIGSRSGLTFVRPDLGPNCLMGAQWLSGRVIDLR